MPPAAIAREWRTQVCREIKYRPTHLVTGWTAHAGEVADELTSHENALRKLPLPYSLALRLREAGVAPEVVSEYVDVDEAALEGVYRIAEAKLSAAEDRRSQELVENGRTWTQNAQ
jgi:hypothetical protein